MRAHIYVCSYLCTYVYAYVYVYIYVHTLELFLGGTIILDVYVQALRLKDI